MSIDTEIKELFSYWILSENDGAIPSIVDGYIKRVGMVCNREHINWEELLSQITEIVQKYGENGAEKYFGRQYNKAIINSLINFERFVNEFYTSTSENDSNTNIDITTESNTKIDETINSTNNNNDQNTSTFHNTTNKNANTTIDNGLDSNNINTTVPLQSTHNTTNDTSGTIDSSQSSISQINNTKELSAQLAKQTSTQQNTENHFDTPKNVDINSDIQSTPYGNQNNEMDTQKEESTTQAINLDFVDLSGLVESTTPTTNTNLVTQQTQYQTENTFYETLSKNTSINANTSIPMDATTIDTATPKDINTANNINEFYQQPTTISTIENIFTQNPNDTIAKYNDNKIENVSVTNNALDFVNNIQSMQTINEITTSQTNETKILQQDTSKLHQNTDNQPIQSQQPPMIESVAQYLDIISKIQTNVQSDISRNSSTTHNFSVFYRGQDNEYGNGPMASALRQDRQAYEKEFYFQATTMFPQEFEGLSQVDKLAKMQHYRWPTRLIDFTTNPLIALYFACEQKNISDNQSEDSIDSNAVIYYHIAKDKNKILSYQSDRALLLACLAKMTQEEQIIIKEVAMKCKITKDRINKNILDTKILKDSSEASKIETTISKFYGEAWRERNAFQTYNTNPDDLLESFMLLPQSNMFKNTRLKGQAGVFCIVGLDQKCVECQKIKINATKIKNILDELDTLGVNRVSIYNDLESVSSYMIDKLTQKR